MSGRRAHGAPHYGVVCPRHMVASCSCSGWSDLRPKPLPEEANGQQPVIVLLSFLAWLAEWFS